MLAKAKIAERIEQLKAEQEIKQKDFRDKMATRIQALARGKKGRARFNRLAPTLRREIAMREICVECEAKKATRKCRQCRDRYCEICYIKIHKKGFRKTHTFEPLGKVGPNGVVVEEEEDGNTVGLGFGTTKKGGKAVSNPKGDWEELWDSSAKAKYWFNKVTGDAVWVKPY